MTRYVLIFVAASLFAFVAVAQTPDPAMSAASTDTISVLAFNIHDPLPFLPASGFQPTVFFIIITTDPAIEAYRVTIFYDDSDGNPQTRTLTVDRNRTPTASIPDPPTYATFAVSARRLRYAVMPMGALGASLQSN